MKITITARHHGSATVADPDPLIAAVPALLGFVPERSIVLMCFDDDLHVIATMRHDLQFTPRGRTSASLRALFDHLGDLAASYGACGIIAVLIDDRYEPADERYARVSRDMDRMFADAGGLSAAFAIGEMRAGAYWRTAWQTWRAAAVFGREFAPDGTLSDPQASPIALQRAFETGRVVLHSRSEIAAMLTPVEHCADSICTAVTPATVSAPMCEADGPRLARVYEAVLDRACGTTALSCEQVNELAEALVSVHVRDAAIGLSMTIHREAAQSLWLDLTRRLSGTPRAAAATLLGHLHYMAGSGAFAATAFDVAHEADPSYGLANLLDTALMNGMRPQELVGLADLSFDLAQRLGVTFPPATYRAAG
ncbi:DUF4192 domain-containing protein [Gordonia sp. (in: high G+C Gram-positive bacteria)]|uniref:DUF4192 domain-containing protein n=1 Tax=Gordonia sp. (in: high G+C Gram-positive bacteria) TaxID=84139 RepID=UPI003F9B766C